MLHSKFKIPIAWRLTRTNLIQSKISNCIFSYPFSDFRVAPGFDGETLAEDVCLIKWDEPITYSSRIQPICITEKKVNEFSPGFISAWAEEDQFMLHEAEMFVMDFNNCNKAKGSIFSMI